MSFTKLENKIVYDSFIGQKLSEIKKFTGKSMEIAVKYS